MHTIQQIKKQLRQFIQKTDPSLAVVCFDFFDTLASRSVMPEYTKRIAANQLSILLNDIVSGSRIYEIRHRLEASLCKKNAEAGFDLEFDLCELALRLHREIADQITECALASKDSNFVDTFINIEVAVEKLVQQSCDDMIGLLKEVKKAGCKTVLISDFYLPQKYFVSLLDFHEIAGCFDHIYISADHLISKGSGRLYEFICSELQLSPSALLMIGDNPHADKRMAEEKGLSSLLVDRSDLRQRYDQWETNLKKDKNDRSLQKLLVQQCKESGLQYFPEISLTIWNFVRKLFYQLLQERVTATFFLSREGEFLRELFEIFQRENFGHIHIKAHYLIVSRKSCYIGSLKSLEDENFEKLFYQYRDISARDFLLSLNLPENEAVAICREAGVVWDKKHTNFPDSAAFSKLTGSERFRVFYETLRLSQKNNFIRYLKSFGVDPRKAKVVLVDVGWKGSMQENLFRMFGTGFRSKGFYIGLLKSAFEQPEVQKVGVLFAEVPEQSVYFSVYNNNRSLFEMILGASHGSAEGYFTSYQEIIARDDNRLKVHSTVQDEDGEILITTCEQSEEIDLYKAMIKPFQSHIKSLFFTLNKTVQLSCREFSDERWFAKQHGRMVFLPSKAEIEFFENLYHLENFGVFEFTRFVPTQKISWKRKMYNLISVIRDPAILEIGFWPPVILNHLGIGVYRYIDGVRRYCKVFGFWKI